MANPITWRNVNAPSAGGAADLFGQAQASFDGAIKAARDTKDGFEKGRTDRNTQAFMNQLQQYGSSEELAAAQQSGALADLRGQFGSMVDQDKVSADAVTDRVTNLQGRETAQYDRKQMLTERADKPLVDTFTNRLASISSDQGIEGIGQAYDGFQSDVKARVDTGELSTSAGTQLIRDGQKRVSALEQNFDTDQARNRNQAQQQWKDAARGAVTEYGQQVAKGTPVKPIEQAMVTSLREQGVPEKYITNARTQFNSAANSGVVFGARDQAELDNQRSSIERDYNYDTNVYAKEGTFVPEEATNALLAETMQTDEDGREFFFQDGDTEARTELTKELTGALSNGVEISVNGTKRTVPVAQAHARAALRNIQGGDWEINSTFQEEIKNVLKQVDAYGRSKEYTEGKRALSNFDANQLKYLTGTRNNQGQSQKQSQEQEQQETEPSNSKIPDLFKPGSVNDGAGAEFGRDVVGEFKNTLRMLGGDIKNENDLGVLATLNPNVEGSAANLVSKGVGMWRDASNVAGSTITGAFTPNIASSPQTAAVNRVQSALQAGEKPTTSDLDQAMKLASVQPDLFTKEAISLLIKATQ